MWAKHTPCERKCEAPRQEAPQDVVGGAPSPFCINGGVDLLCRIYPPWTGGQNDWPSPTWPRLSQGICWSVIEQDAERPPALGCCSAAQFALWPYSVREGVLPFWELAGRGGACYLSENTNCCVVIVWISLGSCLTPTHLFFSFFFSKWAFFFVLETNRCEANNQGDDRVVFKALQQHVIMSIYMSARGRIQHAAASMYEYQTCVKLKRRRQKTCTKAVQLFLLNCIHLHRNDHLWQWKVCRALIRLKRWRDECGSARMHVRSYHWQ